MKRIPIAVALILTLSTALWAQSSKKEVIGYYPSWKWKSRNNLVTPDRIPYEKLTIINYAFFAPLPDGSIAGKDTVGDALYIRGNPGTTLTGLAHRRGVKVLLSLGGWEDSGNFPAVASTSALRTAFAHSCVGAIREFGFDGIDIDWEFPGYVDHNGTPKDSHNFTLLLRSLRDSLDALGRQTGGRFLLTAALPSSRAHTDRMEVQQISEILDQLNIMTYDFYGPWDPLANHNCPLYPSRGADSTRCVAGALDLFHSILGIPTSKINIGVPFYGQTYTQCTTLNGQHKGPDTIHFSPFGAFYYDIVRQMDKFTRHWDDRAKVPYLVCNEWNLLISYDDEESIRAKTQYILDNDVHGLIIWEITGDYLPDGTTPLLNTIHATLPPSKATDY